MSATDLHRTIEAVWRIESARVIAGLTRLTRDVGLAEDLAQEALLAALEQWPQSGVPENPGYYDVDNFGGTPPAVIALYFLFSRCAHDKLHLSCAPGYPVHRR